MAKIGQIGGMDLSPAMQKIYDKLVELLKDGKKLDISINELKKKAGVSNVNNSSVSAFIIREKNKGTKFFKNISVTQFSGAFEAGSSVHDPLYKSSKKFKDFYSATYDKPWSDATASNKNNAVSAFERYKGKITKTGFTLSPAEMAKKLGITENTLLSYQTPGFKGVDSTTIKFIGDNVKRIRTLEGGKSIALYKEPSETLLKNWKILQGRQQISSALVKRVEEYNKVFRDFIIEEKRLPTIEEVIKKTSMKTPSEIARTEALYSRLLRGEKFRRNIDVAVNASAGKRIIDLLSLDSSYNSRRTAFYNLALDNINKAYNQSGTLGTFKSNFRDELKKILGLKKGQKVPFSVNEVIGLSTGESRGIQPFSVFVDAVERNINKTELASYQGAFSKKLKTIQGLLSGDKPNISAAEEIAGNLELNRNTLVNRLTKKGYTTSQINQLNIPDIKIGENVLETYKAKDLARYKEAGVDIAQFAKDKKFYIDIKKAKPFWESNVRNTIIEAAKNNIGNVCGIFKGRVAYSADGGRIGFQGGCAGEMTAAMETNAKGTLQQITKTEGILPKFQNAAKGFLGILGRGGAKAAPLAALAAVGAGIEPLVKQFVADDPETYLTNENQMKGMLLATIEGETPKVDEEILKWQMPALGAATAAGAIPGAGEAYKARRGLPPTKSFVGPMEKGVGPVRSALGIKGVLGKALGATFSPLAVAATLPMDIAAQRKGGTEWGDIATDPLHWMGPAFMSSGAEMASKGIKNPILLKALRMGMSPRTLRLVSSKFGIPGLAISAGMWGYDKWKNRSINDED